MVKVIAWPPLPCIGREWSLVDPTSVSYDQNGTPYFSQSMPRRRVATFAVPGIATDYSSAGYVEMLKDEMQGGTQFVRLQSMPAVWHGALRGLGGLRGQVPLDWWADSRTLDWTSGGGDLTWVTGAPLAGSPVVDGDYQGVRVTGLPPSRIVAFPSELLRISDGTTTQSARVYAVARSDADGVAVIRVKGAITISGDVVIGARDSAVFMHIGELPRAMQPVVGNWQYDFSFIEILPSEASSFGGFVEVDPWR